MNILVVDDEPAIVLALRPVLVALGHTVIEAGDGRAALTAVEANNVDLVLLDLGLPDTDGCDLIAKIKQTANAAIVILSARHIERDKVRALDEGADDYVDKPFSLDELLARIRVIERRSLESSSQAATRIQNDFLLVDFVKREVVLMGVPIRLSPKEFALFEVMARSAGQVVTQRRLMIAGWNDPKVDGQYLRSYMALLRDKFEADPSNPSLILTEPGVGYRLAADLIPVK